MILYMFYVIPLGSNDGLTLSDSRYLRKLTIREWGGRGALKTSLHYVLENCFINRHHIMQVGVSCMFQLKLLKNSRFSPFYSDFKIKSSENSCKK